MQATAKTGATGRTWQSRFGCCAALSLSVLEIKRLLLLALEMLVDSRAIRFAGALLPFVFSFVDVGLGFPVAVAALLLVRKNQARACYPNKKRGLRRIASMLTICAILNVLTLVLIGCKINLEVDSLREAFRASMRLYARNASYKLAIDELQLDLQCCGFSSYADWFSFDWQGMDYEEESEEKEYAQRSVPFSCCSKRSILPCLHAEMRGEDARTVNNLGCAIVLARILFKIAIVGYTMTGLILCTQILLVLFFVRIIRKVMPDICPSDCSCWESSCPITAAIVNSSSDECASPCQQQCSRYRHPNDKTCTRASPRVRRRPRKLCSGSSTSRCSSRSLCTTSCSSDSSSSSYARLTSSPSFVPKRNRKASTTANAELQQKHAK